jgi:alcohol dehydrogenase
MDPVTDGLGHCLVGVFDETTPEKRLGTAVRGARRLDEVDADVVVAVGGGSSLDTAKVLSLVAASDRDPASLGNALVEDGTLPVPDGGLVPVIAVPTTLAGADLSMVAGVTADPESGLVESAANGGVGHPELMPQAVISDPELLATTPRDVLAASAMNGFDKGIETLYAETATPVTDATALRGLARFREGLLAFGDGDDTAETYRALADGALLVQYGISRPAETTLSLIHAVGHGLTRTYDVQQGAAHGIVAPHALRYLFERVDGRRALLASALDVDPDADPATGVVDAVVEVRDALGLPTRLRDVDGPDPEEFDEVAQTILEDGFMANAPVDLDPTGADLRAVLEAAW